MSGSAEGKGAAPRIMFLAGENSGDLHAARVIRELKTLLPGATFFGYGGVRMEADGMRLEHNLAQSLPIIGISQVAKNIRPLLRLFRRAEELLAEADLLVLVDYPGFNLRLAKSACERGVPVVYYISPQVWAWKKGRVKTIARCVARMLVIFPFEQKLYERAGVPATYVGHPLQDDLADVAPREDTLRRLGVDAGRTVIGLIPGSRESEIVRHLPVMLEAARVIQAKLPGAAFVLPRASTIPRELVDKYLARVPEVSVTVAEGEEEAKSVRAALDFAICKSGTATLELALLQVPMVIIYKMSWPTWIFAKAVLRIKDVGLANIVAGESIVPELIQHRASGAGIARTVLGFLQDEAKLERQREKLRGVREQFGGPGASRRAAEAIAEVVRGRLERAEFRRGAE